MSMSMSMSMSTYHVSLPRAGGVHRGVHEAAGRVWNDVIYGII